MAGIRQVLLFMAITLLVLPGVAKPLCDEMGHEEEPCETGECLCAHVDDEATDSQPPADDCCTDGCRSCGLRCCGGSASILTPAPDVGLDAPVRAASVAMSSDLSMVDLDPIYHPPRA